MIGVRSHNPFFFLPLFYLIYLLSAGGCSNTPTLPSFPRGAFSPAPQKTPSPSSTGGIPRIVEPEDGDEGTFRDLTIVLESPIADSSSLHLTDAGEFITPLRKVDSVRYKPEEVLLPLHTYTVKYGSYSLLSFTTGTDIAGDPLRIYKISPDLRIPVPSALPLLLHFSQRVPTDTTFLPVVRCDGEEVLSRFFFQKRGAQGWLEPLFRWKGNSVCIVEFPVIERNGTPLPHFLNPLSFTTIELTGRLRISEVVVDPQQDWSDDTGTPFDPIPGEGSITSSDEYVEIVNASNDFIDLREYRLEMIDGTDEVFLFSNPSSAILRFNPPWATVTSFPPCGVVVIGNPRGENNNQTLFRLVDGNNRVVDQIHLTGASSLQGLPGVYYNPAGGGNATGPENEAVYPLWVTGENPPLVQGYASPTSAPCP